MDEPCVYKKISWSEVIFIILYVNDILLIKNNISLLQFVKIWFSKNFSIRYMRKATYIPIYWE